MNFSELGGALTFYPAFIDLLALCFLNAVHTLGSLRLVSIVYVKYYIEHVTV